MLSKLLNGLSLVVLIAGPSIVNCRRTRLQPDGAKSSENLPADVEPLVSRDGTLGKREEVLKAILPSKAVASLLLKMPDRPAFHIPSRVPVSAIPMRADSLGRRGRRRVLLADGFAPAAATGRQGKGSPQKKDSEGESHSKGEIDALTDEEFFEQIKASGLLSDDPLMQNAKSLADLSPEQIASLSSELDESMAHGNSGSEPTNLANLYESGKGLGTDEEFFTQIKAALPDDPRLKNAKSLNDLSDEQIASLSSELGIDEGLNAAMGDSSKTNGGALEEEQLIEFDEFAFLSGAAIFVAFSFGCNTLAQVADPTNFGYKAIARLVALAAWLALQQVSPKSEGFRPAQWLKPAPGRDDGPSVPLVTAIFAAFTLGIPALQALTGQGAVVADAGSALAMPGAGQVAFSLLGAPISEEIFFRGYVLRAFPRTKLFKGNEALVASSVLFGLWHVFGNPAPWFIYALQGFWYGTIYQRTGNLAAPVAAHIGFNTLAMLIRVLLGGPAFY